MTNFVVQDKFAKRLLFIIVGNGNTAIYADVNRNSPSNNRFAFSVHLTT